jgi:hypothetical protein
MRFCEIWKEQCEAARQIEDEFGTQKALEYLIGGKFLNFLQAAETDAEFRAEIPAFVGEIKTIFEPWQLADHLETARQTEPFDPSLSVHRSYPVRRATTTIGDPALDAASLLPLASKAKARLIAH